MSFVDVLFGGSYCDNSYAFPSIPGEKGQVHQLPVGHFLMRQKKHFLGQPVFQGHAKFGGSQKNRWFYEAKKDSLEGQ